MVLLKDLFQTLYFEKKIRRRQRSMQSYPACIELKHFFFYFLVYGSSDVNFCILEKKKKKILLTFFISSDVKNCQIFYFFLNIAISAFLLCKIIQFLLFFYSDPNMFQIE